MMSSSLETAVRLALRRAFRQPPGPQVRAITLDLNPSWATLKYHLTVFHHGPASDGLLERLKAMHATALADLPPDVISSARLTLKRRDRPKPILSNGLPILVEPGALVIPPLPAPPPASPVVSAAGPTLDALEPLSSSTLAKQPLTREAARARSKPLNQLKPEALLLLLHDGRGLKHILPHALKAARLDPWADRGLHIGDLMMAVLHAPAGLRPRGTVLHKGIVALANAALKAAARLPGERRKPDLEAEIARLIKRWQAR